MSDSESPNPPVENIEENEPSEQQPDVAEQQLDVEEAITNDVDSEIDAEVVVKEEEEVKAEIEFAKSPVKLSETPSKSDSEWETSPGPVGLDSLQTAVVLETERALKTPEPTDAELEQSKQDWSTKKPETPSKIPTPIKEGNSNEINFQPVLVSSAKKRDAAKSTGYGKSVVGKKPVKAPEGPTFKPNLQMGKVTDQKREKSCGSQYGKAIPKKKVVAPPTPTFTPELIDSSPITKNIRSNAKSKIYESQKKAAEKGKQARKEHEKRLAATPTISRYTLAKDHTEAASTEEEKSDKPPMVLDGQSFASLDHNDDTKRISNNSIVPSDVTRSKHGEKLLSKAVSHYNNDTYQLPKGQKPIKADEPKWEINPKAQILPSSDLAYPSEKSVKTDRAISKYGKDYAPPKSVRPCTPKEKSNLNLNFAGGDSPLHAQASEIPKPQKSSKNVKVSSSGYGVVSPTPSVPKKVESYKHRGGQDMLRTKGLRDANSLAQTDVVVDDAEKENPTPLNENSSALVDDLLTRAAMLDPKSIQSVEKKPAVLAEDNGAEIIVDQDEDTQLTML